MERWLIPKLEQDTYKMNPECPVVPESKEVLKLNQTKLNKKKKKNKNKQSPP